MDLRQAAYVVAVVDEGGFTRAAASIPISQPALSQSIRTLERELGVELFHRLGRDVRLTSAGEAFLGPARQLLRDADNARAAVAEVRGLTAGHVDIVAIPTLVVEPLVDLVGAFRRLHPDITVRIIEPEDTAAIVDLVRTGSCELGLGEAPIEHPALETDLLLRQELLAVLPPGTLLPGRRRLPAARLGDVPLIATPEGTSTRRLVTETLQAAGVDPVIAVESDHREAIIPLVLAGAGGSLLPEPLARQAEAQGAAVAKLDPPVKRGVVLVRRTGALSPAARSFRDLALDRVGT
ncbi:MAG TPA: LysR substrate-binding domain-containing protein [Acidimicrobiales bacterium]